MIEKRNPLTGEYEPMSDTDLLIDHIKGVRQQVDALRDLVRMMFWVMCAAIGFVVGAYVL
jgi:hypothetical protein